jgi:hypothetical protein
MKLRRQLEQDRRAIGVRLDQKDRYRSSLEKLDHPACQIGQSSFYKEKTYAQNDYQK